MTKIVFVYRNVGYTDFFLLETRIVWHGHSIAKSRWIRSRTLFLTNANMQSNFSTRHRDGYEKSKRTQTSCIREPGLSFSVTSSFPARINAHVSFTLTYTRTTSLTLRRTARLSRFNLSLAYVIPRCRRSLECNNLNARDMQLPIRRIWTDQFILLRHLNRTV